MIKLTQGERVKEVRKEKGLTMEKFGERLGVTKTAISLIESGKNNLTDANTKAICREFNISEEWLRTGTGEMHHVQGGDNFTEVAARIDKSDPKARRAILEYWALSEKDKELWWNFMERFITKKDGAE